MLKIFYFVPLVILTAKLNAQSADLTLPVGKSTFNIDKNQKVNWSGTNLNYDMGNLKYAGSFVNNSQVHNFNIKMNELNMSYSSSSPKNVVGLKYRGFTFTSEDFNRNEIQNVFASKVLVDNKNTLTYQQKQLSFSMSKTLTRNFNINSYNLQTKNTKLEFTNSEKPLVMLDAWNRPYVSTTSASVQFANLSYKSMDNYEDFSYNSSGLNLRRIVHPNRSENALKFSAKSYSVNYIEFNDKYSKNFLDINSKDFKLKMANDGETKISQLETKNTVIAHGNDQTYIQSKANNLEYRLSDDHGKTNYDVKTGNIGVRDGQVYGVVTPVKNLSVKASSENGVEQVSYQATLDKTNISMKYNNQFDVYDFYFKQNAFNVYENSFTMIGNSRSQFKDSFSFSLVNPKFNFASDVINDIYAITFKDSGSFVLSAIKDQKQNFVGLTNSSRIGNIGIQYNMNTNMFDRFYYNYVIKF
jgi:hypothetical protein